VIWPGILLGHNGEGDHGGTVGPLGELRLPDELVSSEYLTMSGSKFSTSRGKVIYVGDFPRDFGPGCPAVLHCRSWPETADTDFTWDEFVRRTNFELANEWGNLVNRSISMAYKNNGAIPAPNTSSILIMTCYAPLGRRSTPWALCSAAAGSSSRSLRPCGWSGRKQVHLRHRAVEAGRRS
jgi:methionyl-tRNA synthetase